MACEEPLSRSANQFVKSTASFHIFFHQFWRFFWLTDLIHQCLPQICHCSTDDVFSSGAFESNLTMSEQASFSEGWWRCSEIFPLDLVHDVLDPALLCVMILFSTLHSGGVKSHSIIFHLDRRKPEKCVFFHSAHRSSCMQWQQTQWHGKPEAENFRLVVAEQSLTPRQRWRELASIPSTTRSGNAVE